MTNKKVGSYPSFNGGSFPQSIDYSYNIRGWMTKVNDPDNLGSDLFGYTMKYNNPENTSLSTGRFNENIAEIDLRTSTVASDNKEGILLRIPLKQAPAGNLLRAGIISDQQK